jgi:hypothetical protein
MKPEQVVKVRVLVDSLVAAELECRVATQHRNEQQGKLNAYLQECVVDDPRNPPRPPLCQPASPQWSPANK